MRQIVILGAGYGGLMTALKLEEKTKNMDDVNIVLVDRNDFHQYIHLSYEIVTGVKKGDDITIPISELIQKRKIQFYQAEVESIDLSGKTVQTSKGPLPFTELVIALGSEPTFFDIKGAAEYSFCVCSVESAENIKKEILKDRAQNPNVKIIVGGGGFTGVELAGEIADELKCCVTMIEATNMLLPTWGLPDFSKKVTSVLENMGTEFIFNKSIVEVKPNVIVLNDGSQIEYSIFIWTAGVQANHLVIESGLKTGKGKRAVINQYCEAADYPGVYVVGDCALVIDPETGRILPQCIEIAHQQADIVAKNLLADIEGTVKVAYIPKFYGLILAVGEKYGIGKISGITIEGKLALMVKKVVHLHYVYQIAGITEAIDASMW